MDFAFLPPEVNSARMYSGPGPGPLLAAAASWESLSAELGVAAETYRSVVSGLTTEHWRGPASQSMTATAAPYVAWLATTAEQAAQTAVQARAAAAAFEQAYAMTVPPQAVMANRIQLISLIATNFFGQNTPAIAATEAQYAEMWAQDAAAMSGYAINSAAAAQLTSFSSPQQTTNPTGLTAQSAAVTQANSSAAAASPASQLVSTVSQSLQSLQAASPGVTGVPPSLLPNNFTALEGMFAVYATIGVTKDVESIAAKTIGAENDLGILPNLGLTAETPALDAGLAAGPQVAGAAPGLAGQPGPVVATLARANSLGPLSVPASWTVPASGPASALSGQDVAPLPGPGEVGMTRSGVPGIPGVPAGKVWRPSGVIPRYGLRITVMSRPLAGG